MKKHEKDLTKFSLTGCRARGLKQLYCMAIAFAMFAEMLNAQNPCEPEAQFFASVANGQLLLQVALPSLDSTTAYAWSTTGLGGFSGTGTTLSATLPTGPTTFSVNLNVANEYLNSNCSKTVTLLALCQEANFTFSPNECSVSFYPSTPGAISHYWTFGDGNSSTAASPSHIYLQQGSYTVCHTITIQGPNGTIIVDTCCKVVDVECSGGGGGNGTIDPSECCRLKVCFSHPIQDPTAAYFWDFGDCHTSTEMNPCNYYDNISTYPLNQGGTPSVAVQRCITPSGGTQSCSFIFVNLVSLSQPAAIYVGEPGVTTPMDVVSCINGMPLFPGATMVGPKEIHNIGELGVNKSFTFSNNINFCMDPCSGMEISHYRILTFDNNITVKNKCCLWRSIDLGYSSTFVSKNNNNIEGAQYGLRTLANGVVLQLSDTYFYDNWVGIFARHPLTFATFDRNLFHANAIDPHCSALSCDQELQSLLQIPHLQRGFAGIVGRNTIINLPAGAAADNNVFRFMDNGIWLHNSDAEIRRSDFLFIEDEVYGEKSGNAIRFNVANGTHSLKQWGDGTEISYSSTGVRVETAPGTVDNSFIDSRNNHMDVNKYGYRLEIGGILAAGSTIRDNQIFSNHIGIEATMKNAENSNSHLNIAMNHIAIDEIDNGIGILVNDAVPPTAATMFHDINVLENFVTLNKGRSAIEVNNFKGTDVAFNVLQINETSGGNAPPYPPIGIYASGGKKNIFRCNTVTGTSTGGPQHAFVTEASRDNTISGNATKTTRIGFDFRGICGSTTDFICNTMENHDVAMRFWLGAKTGNQFNKGNQWLGTAFGIAAWHMGTLPSHLNDCRFKAATGTNQWPPSIDAPNGSPLWFTSGSFVACSDECNWMFQPDSTNDMDLAIATTGFDMPTNNGVYNWDARRYLYNKLAANPALANQSATYSSFQANQAGTSVGLLQSAVEQTHGLFAIPAASQQALDTNFAAIQAAISSISTIDATIAAGGLTESQLANLLTDKETQTTNLVSLQTSTEQLQAQLLVNRTTAANNVIAFNNGILTNAVHDQNEKTLLGIYLNTEAKNLPMTLAQKAQVLGIAEQCPESGGYVTYWARAWYTALTGILVGPQGCMSVGERSGTTGKQEGEPIPTVGQFQIAPNPAQDFVTVTFDPQSDWEDASIVLLDAAGLARLTQKIEHGDKETTLSIQNLPNGVYWVSLKPDGHATSVQKLVILR